MGKNKKKKKKSEKPIDNNADAMTRPTRWGLVWGVLRANLSLSTQEYNPMPLLCRPVISKSIRLLWAHNRRHSNSHAILVWSINYFTKEFPSLVLSAKTFLLFLVFVKASRRLWCSVHVANLGRDARGILFLLESLVQHDSSSHSSSSNKHACKTDSPPSIMPDPFANAVKEER